MISLDLDLPILRRPAGAAALLELPGQLLQRLRRQLEPAGNRDRLPAAPLPVEHHADVLRRRRRVAHQRHGVRLPETLRLFRISREHELRLHWRSDSRDPIPDNRQLTTDTRYLGTGTRNHVTDKPPAPLRQLR